MGVDGLLVRRPLRRLRLSPRARRWWRRLRRFGRVGRRRREDRVLARRELGPAQRLPLVGLALLVRVAVELDGDPALGVPSQHPREAAAARARLRAAGRLRAGRARALLLVAGCGGRHGSFVF